MMQKYLLNGFPVMVCDCETYKKSVKQIIIIPCINLSVILYLLSKVFLPNFNDNLQDFFKKKKKRGVNMGANRCNDYIYILKKNFKNQRDMALETLVPSLRRKKIP